MKMKYSETSAYEIQTPENYKRKKQATFRRREKVRNQEEYCWLGRRLGKYEGWNFNSGNYLFTTDTK